MDGERPRKSEESKRMNKTHNDMQAIFAVQQGALSTILLDYGKHGFILTKHTTLHSVLCTTRNDRECIQLNYSMVCVYFKRILQEYQKGDMQRIREGSAETR